MTQAIRCRVARATVLCAFLGGLVATASCSFDPNLPEGRIACTGQQASNCPPGFTCQTGFCRSHPLPDNSVDTGGTLDAVADAPSNSPLDSSIDSTVDLGATTDARVVIPEVAVDGNPVAPDLGGAPDHGDPDIPPPPDAARPEVVAVAEAGSPDLPYGPEVGLDAPADAPTDAPACSTTCTPGNTRCGTSGIETCQIVGSCPQWGPPTACPGSRTCQGLAPSAACTCPTAPPACTGGPGSLCESSTVVASCGLGADGCLTILQRTTCPSGKPCTGTYPSASCSCPAGPAECQNATGTVCQSASKVGTCALDSSGCVAVTATVDCPLGTSCQGGFPAASCRCPAPPSHCASAGTSCLDSVTLATCTVDGNGCVVSSSSMCSLIGKVCSGAFPGATCACPAAPAGCESGAGASCSGTTVVTCATSSNGCLAANQAACPTGKPCGGAFPSAACACPVAPAYCGGAGLACADGSTLATCALDGNSCMAASTSSCSTSGKVCTGTLPSAQCTCPATPAECTEGAGSHCSNGSTQITCTASTGGCLSSATTPCSTGQYCSGVFPAGACAAPVAVGWYDDLGSAGDHSANYLLGHPITVTTPSVLRKFGLISRGAASAQMALYTSAGTGEPATRVAYVSGVSVVAGRNEFAPTSPSSAPTLAAGTYWIMMVFSAKVSIAHDTSIVAPRRYVAFTYGGGLPDPMPTTTSSPGPQSNYYILTTPQ